MKKIALYLDDLRNPTTDKNWVVLRSTAEAVAYVVKHGTVTSFISLDHDLGGEDTAMMFIKWLIDYDMDNNGTIIPSDFEWGIHSANPVGSANMDSLLTSYMTFKKNNLNKCV